MANTRGTRQHYLPACIIGRFSDRTSGALRKRTVYVMRRGQKEIFTQKAEALCWKKGMYDFRQYSGTIDNWQYEDHLTATLDNLENRKYPEMETFVHVLVPYVTGLFLRGPDYELRRNFVLDNCFTKARNTSDDVNGSRAMTLQRVLSVILTAEWCYRTVESGTRLLLPDTGLCRCRYRSQPAWVVPVSSSSLFEIRLRKRGCIAHYMPEYKAWVPMLKVGVLTSEEVSDLNSEMQRQSFTQCFAQCPEVFDADYPNLSASQTLILSNSVMDIETFFSTEELISHEFEWYSVARISADHLSPTNARKIFLNRPNLYMGIDRWSPPMVMLPSNLKPFRSGIKIRGRKMFLDLHAPRDFKSYIRK